MFTCVKAVIGEHIWPLSLCLNPLFRSLNLTPDLALGLELELFSKIIIFINAEYISF